MADNPNDDKANHARPQKTARSKQNGYRKHRQHQPNQTDLDWAHELLSKPVKIMLKSRTQTISTFEAIVAAISLKAVAGDPRALALQLKYRAFAAQTSRKKSRVEVVFADNDYTRALATISAAKRPTQASWTCRNAERRSSRSCARPAIAGSWCDR